MKKKLKRDNIFLSALQASALPRAGFAMVTLTARISRMKSLACQRPASPPSTPVPTTPRSALHPIRSATARWTAATAQMKDPSAVVGIRGAAKENITDGF